MLHVCSGYVTQVARGPLVFFSFFFCGCNLHIEQDNISKNTLVACYKRKLSNHINGQGLVSQEMGNKTNLVLA